MKKIIILGLALMSINTFASNGVYVFQIITSCGQGEAEQFEVPHVYCQGDTQGYSNWYNITAQGSNVVKVEGAYNRPNSDIGFEFQCKNGKIESVISETKCFLGGD